MSRPTLRAWVLLLTALTLAPGCRPQQPFYFHDDGDLSHYVGQGTELEEPDLDEPLMAEVAHPHAPRSLVNAGGKPVWALTLEEAVSISLANSKVFRQLGGRIVPGNSGPSPDVVLRNPAAISSVYNPALQVTLEENALSVYDPRFTASAIGSNEKSPVNTTPIAGFFSGTREAHSFSLAANLEKRMATGGLVGISHRWDYDRNNGQANVVDSTWGVPLEVRVEQPLLRFNGVGFNRVHGPVEQSFGNVLRRATPFRPGNTPQNFDGITIARINTDIQLAEFEAGVRNLVNDVESAYWNLYFAYRNLGATRAGRDSALATWKRINALKLNGSKGGEQENWAQAKEQYYLFRGQMENALTEVYRAESRVRYIMGLAATDDRLIKPADEPTTAKVGFDWNEVHCESLARSVELRQQKWRIKQRELELVATKNIALPGLDAFAGYRWDGLGDHLTRPSRTGSVGLAGRTAYENLTDGEFQTWDAGLAFSMQLGMRGELANIRRQELLLARERAVLEDQELEISHQIADAIREMEGFYIVTQTAFNRRVSAKQQVEAVKAAYDAGTATLDLLLDAQRRLSDADVEYYRSLVNYNLSITTVHFRKNSLLEYNGIYLSEGPWPGKAYFDATRLARKRDAGLLWDYGWTEPAVVSRGPTSQDPHAEGNLEPMPTMASQEVAVPQGAAPHAAPETIAPDGAPAQRFPAPPAPKLETVPAPKKAQGKGPHRVADQRGPARKLTSAASSAGETSGNEKFDWGSFSIGPDPATPGVQPATYQPEPRHESRPRAQR